MTLKLASNADRMNLYMFLNCAHGNRMERLRMVDKFFCLSKPNWDFTSGT